MDICEFFTVNTLEAIDWGILDMSRFDADTRPALYVYEQYLPGSLGRITKTISPESSG